ncbi:MAG: CBS domain-containing protein [Burkholderiales bacterium]|nr:CBS domain-containing protein [Burkholderiales bacterium]
MDEPPPGPARPSLLERLSALLMRAPEDREQLIALLRSARARDILDAEALAMIEGVLGTSELTAADVMVPRARMDVIDVATPLADSVPMMIRAGHSRFPVVEGDRDEVIGILHAKDLLRLVAGQPANLRELLRPVAFVPESKRLDNLLRQFRVNRNHLAIVVDEYGGVAGLVTIEDVLEQIVGEIDDEFDLGEADEGIVDEPGGTSRVRAITEIDDVNRHFGTRLEDADAATIGGLIVNHCARVPARGETCAIGGLRFTVLRADSRQLHLLRVARENPPA